MAIVQNWLPPSRENYELICYVWQFFPVITAFQWLLDWYPQGKTSIDSRINIPGKIGWATMESVGFTTLLYIFFTLPSDLGIKGLPWGNWIMAGCFVIHYIHRAVLAPLYLNPSMSPIHPLVWIMAFLFQMFNAVSIGGYLAGYGPTTDYHWANREVPMVIGLIVWCGGLLGNIYHDDVLREIRRAADRRQRKVAAEQGRPVESIDKVYIVPHGGLFKYALHAHYLCEWIEWAGWWMIGGWSCAPARAFLINEVTTMLPRALQGKRWYVKKFGRAAIGNRKAVIPGLV